MSQSLGARLRHRREEQGIALATIAERTKIKASLLAAFERDDVSHWPGGIFRRSFIRAYAEAIHLDADAVVKEFLAAHPEPDEIAAAAALEASPDGTRTSSGPPTRIGAWLRSAVGSLSRRRSHEPAGPVPVEVREAGGRLPPEPAIPAPAQASPSLTEIRRLEIDLPAETASLPEPAAAECVEGAFTVPEPASEPASFEPDLLAVARLCTEFGRVDDGDQVQPLLGEAARLLDANGLIVWMWDDLSGHLRPALAHGYSHRVLAQLPAVDRDADNPTAAAFRSASAVSVSDDTSGALVVPLLASTGCAGVLALELSRGSEDLAAVRAVATIFAAMLVQLTGDAAAPAGVMVTAAGDAAGLPPLVLARD